MEKALLDKIISLRKILNFPLEYIAAKIGISKKEYQLFEQGNFSLDEHKLSRCLEVLGIGNLYERYVNIEYEDKKFKNINFINSNNYNFGNSIDILGEKIPNNLALLHVDEKEKVRKFTFKDISIASARAANYFTSLGIKKGDRVMLVLKSAYQFWPILIALHKIGAVVIPSTHMLKKKDYEYRINEANVKAIIALNKPNIISEINSCDNIEQIELKISVGGEITGFLNYDNNVINYKTNFKVVDVDKNDPMIIFFTSGTTSKPKGVVHSFLYPLSHIVTAKFWQNVNPNGLHYTMSDTGWAKFFWGKVYGQWLCEAPIFAYDYDGRFMAEDILKMIEKYQITSVCAPATNYRMFNNLDLSKFNLNGVHDFTVAGEPLEQDSYNKFCKAVNNQIRPAYGMTEASLVSGNFINYTNNPQTIGTINPMYEYLIVDSNYNEVKDQNQGQLLIKSSDNTTGMLLGYLKDKQIISPLIDGYYHTKDVVYLDEDGNVNFVGRNDDIIKTSGYKVAPPEVEEIIMELPYVKECAVFGVPDQLRGAVVSAYIVLCENCDDNENLIVQIQNYVKSKTSPYKYPRQINFVKELPKTVSGKIDRGQIKKLILS